MKRKIKIRIGIILGILILIGMECFIEFYGPINWLWFIAYGIVMVGLIFYVGFQFWMQLIESWA